WPRCSRVRATSSSAAWCGLAASPGTNAPGDTTTCTRSSSGPEAAKPERAGDDAVVPARDDLAEIVRTVPGQWVERVDDLELLVHAQERLQQVLLRPVEAVVLHPLPGVLPRQKDVVEMNERAAAQTGKDVENDMVDVAARLDGVGGVDDQQVVLA